MLINNNVNRKQEETSKTMWLIQEKQEETGEMNQPFHIAE